MDYVFDKIQIVTKCDKRSLVILLDVTTQNVKDKYVKLQLIYPAIKPALFKSSNTNFDLWLTESLQP